jgi:Na+-transporting NADH:ubiquinone oxidoreductase subunit NqrF
LVSGLDDESRRRVVSSGVERRVAREGWLAAKMIIGASAGGWHGTIGQCKVDVVATRQKEDHRRHDDRNLAGESE